MKIQLNGFDIEINTEETNMTVKVMDASGKELSNNTFEQSLDGDATPNPADMPSAEETASDDSNPEGNETEDDLTGTEDDADLAGGPEVQGEEVTEEELGEGLIPSFEQFKKLNEAKKNFKSKKGDKISYSTGGGPIGYKNGKYVGKTKDKEDYHDIDVDGKIKSYHVSKLK